jgi:uncharacterized damage-inducible protein DinB
MPFGKHLLQLDLEYSRWATERILATCAGLSFSELSRDQPGSHSTILATLNHYFISEEFWTECLVTNSLPPMGEVGAPEIYTPEESHLVAFEANWAKVWQAQMEWFDPLSEGDLEGTLATSLPGRPLIHLTRWELVRHMVNHGTLHRGQAVSMIRALGKQPPNVDIIGYYLHVALQS